MNDEKIMDTMANIETALSDIAKSLRILSNITKREYDDAVSQREKYKADAAKSIKDYQQRMTKQQNDFFSAFMGAMSPDPATESTSNKEADAGLTMDDLEFPDDHKDD